MFLVLCCFLFLEDSTHGPCVHPRCLGGRCILVFNWTCKLHLKKKTLYRMNRQLKISLPVRYSIVFFCFVRVFFSSFCVVWLSCWFFCRFFFHVRCPLHFPHFNLHRMTSWCVRCMKSESFAFKCCIMCASDSLLHKQWANVFPLLNVVSMFCLSFFFYAARRSLNFILSHNSRQCLTWISYCFSVSFSHFVSFFFCYIFIHC